MRTPVRDTLRRATHRAFIAGDRVGVHVLPAHYYSPVASRRALRLDEARWRRRLDPMPFDWDIDAQLTWTREVVSGRPELTLSEMYAGAGEVGGFRYGPIEGQFLFALIRQLQPARFLEVGSGSSTWIASSASVRNVADGRCPTMITACDPYTASLVSELPYVTAKAVSGHQVRAEAEELVCGDVLFIDSTHAVRTGSEVLHLYLEVLPLLSPGVIVHIHDIFLPYLFPPDIYESMFDWQETALVAALLTGNPRLKVLACQSALSWDRRDELKEIFPEYKPRAMRDGLNLSTDGHFPASLWLEIV